MKTQTYKIEKFDWPDFRFQKVRPKNVMRPGPTSRKQLDHNTSRFIDWVLLVLKHYSVDELPTDKESNALALSMNTKNINKLHDLMHPYDWLNYAPTLDNALKDDEVGIRPNRIIISKPSRDK